MRRALIWGIIVWGTAFTLLEIPAHFERVPWPTLSRTIWDGIKSWHPVAYFVAIFTIVLLGHFEFQWSARWLIVIALALGAAVAIHILAR